MQIIYALRAPALVAVFICNTAFAQIENLSQQAEQAMYKATKFMVDSVSTRGGYVWHYLPDRSRRWGEMEAYKTMVWMQDGGTVSAGHMFLAAYDITRNEYYYQAAEKAAAAIIWGQSKEGGWNYLVDFAGERSVKKWYATIGKNGWRLEEFQHYYGNDTYDDDVTSDAARFLLKLYFVKLNPTYKQALNKAINFIIKSQYPNGGWPQRYPLKHDYNKTGHRDYTSFYTFNDEVTWENLFFLIQCYQSLKDERLPDPIKRGMDFYFISQKANGAWGLQYNMKMEVAGARTYEPAAYSPRTTFSNALTLLKLYQYTGDRKFLSTIPAAIRWLEKVKLPAIKTENGKYTHSLFVEPGTDKPIFVHRKGSNVRYGWYYTDTNDTKLLVHMYGKSNINIQFLKDEYARVNALSRDEATKNSPILPGKREEMWVPSSFNRFSRADEFRSMPSSSAESVKNVIHSLDHENRWLVKHVMTSNPYIGDGQNTAPTAAYATTHVGDKTDTSPYPDLTEQEYISTPAYIKNMYLLINYLTSIQKKYEK